MQAHDRWFTVLEYDTSALLRIVEKLAGLRICVLYHHAHIFKFYKYAEKLHIEYSYSTISVKVGRSNVPTKSV